MTVQLSIRERLERCSSLPTLPSIAIKILELCQQENVDLFQISSVLSNDPALAAKLLKTANSPIFALRREVTTISHAVGLLGVNAVRTLVLSFSLSKESKNAKKAGLQSYWQRSILSALAARELCQANYIGIREEAFLCGLLQDIGMLALSRAVGSEYTALLEDANLDHDRLVHLEREKFGWDHAEVGAWLMERWHAPKMLVKIVASTHGLPEVEHEADEYLRFLGRAVSLSGRFADLWAGDRVLAPSRLKQEIAAHEDMGPIDMDAINAKLVEQAPVLSPLFEAQLEATEMSAVLEQAQEVLLALSVRTSQELNDIHEALARLETRTATLLLEAQRDSLTGVANRGYTTTYMEEVFQAAIGSGRHIGVIFADVDHFKLVNDTYGHSAGDTVLRSVAQEIARSIRGGDFVGRYGGEEFIVILRADSFGELATVAERIRHNVESAKHKLSSGRIVGVTISLGCSLLDSKRHLTTSDLLDEADRALYEAKRGGRNQFHLSRAS